jgi:hypothetical protein
MLSFVKNIIRKRIILNRSSFDKNIIPRNKIIDNTTSSALNISKTDWVVARKRMNGRQPLSHSPRLYL